MSKQSKSISKPIRTMPARSFIQAKIDTNVKIALGFTVVVIVALTVGAHAKDHAKDQLFKGGVSKTEKTTPSQPSLTDKYGDAANDPAAADALRKAQGTKLNSDELKAKIEADEALQNGVWKPGADPTTALMSGFVPPNMSPEQAAIMAQHLPKMPRMPQRLSPEQMAGEPNPDLKMAGIPEPMSPYIPIPDSLAAASRQPNTRQLSLIPQFPMSPEQLVGGPGMPPMMMGAPIMPYGVRKKAIDEANQRQLEDYLRDRFGPGYKLPVQGNHNRPAQAKPPKGQHFEESDHQSVVGVCDASGNEITSIQYDPYGNQTVLSGGSVMPDAGFQGMYPHPRSGLYLTLCRPYSPVLGRWLTRDPMDDSYTYCFNDPINYVDPLGLYAIAQYSIGSHTLTVTDSTTGQQVYLSNNFGSGNGPDANNVASQYSPDHGPLPTGPYLIGNSQAVSRTEHNLGPQGNNTWFPLYGQDAKNGGYQWGSHPVHKNPNGSWVNRGEFWMHTGRESNGCMTNIADQSRRQNPAGYPNSADYNDLSSKLQNLGQTPYVYKGSNYVGTLQVVP